MNRRLYAVAGTTVLLLGLGLRLWSLSWGFPLKFGHIDESVVLFYSVRLLTGPGDIGFYDYPGFFLNMLAVTLRGVTGVSHFFWDSPDLAARIVEFASSDARFFLGIARGLSVFFALGTVGLLMALGRRRGTPWLGLGAAALLAVNPLHVLHSHYGTVDVATAFFVILALDRLTVFDKSGKGRDAVLAGAAIGFGAAMKYYPGVLLVPLALSVLGRRFSRRGVLMAMGAGGALGAFVVGTPYTLLAFPEFVARFQHLFPKIVGIPGGSPPYYSATRQFFWGVGVLSFLGALAGLFSKKELKGDGRMIALGTLCLFSFIGLWRTQLPHYGLGLYPPLLFLALLGFSRFGRWRSWAPLLFWCVAFFLSLGQSLNQGVYLAKEDSRLTAGRWVREHLPPGQHLLRFAHTPEFHSTDPFSVKVDFVNQRVKDLRPGGPLPRELEGFDTLIYSSFEPEKDPVLLALKDHFSLAQSFQSFKPRFPHHPAVYVFQTKK